MRHFDNKLVNSSSFLNAMNLKFDSWMQRTKQYFKSFVAMIKVVTMATKANLFLFC